MLYNLLSATRLPPKVGARGFASSPRGAFAVSWGYPSKPTVKC